MCAATLTTWFLCWVIPFWVLLGEKPKKTPAIMGTVAFGSVFGFWLERYILVTPSLVPPEEIVKGAASITVAGLIELGLGVGFLGAFFLPAAGVFASLPRAVFFPAAFANLLRWWAAALRM